MYIIICVWGMYNIIRNKSGENETKAYRRRFSLTSQVLQIEIKDKIARKENAFVFLRIRGAIN